MTPLCPHCFRDSCPWLIKWYAHDFDQATAGVVGPPNGDLPPTDDDCPFFGKPLPPLVAKRLRERLGQLTYEAPAKPWRSVGTMGVGGVTVTLEVNEPGQPGSRCGGLQADMARAEPEEAP